MPVLGKTDAQFEENAAIGEHALVQFKHFPGHFQKYQYIHMYVYTYMQESIEKKSIKLRMFC